jgi:hypothetical protein
MPSSSRRANKVFRSAAISVSQASGIGLDTWRPAS